LVNRAYRDEELHGPVYTFLAERCDQQIDYNIADIRPVLADDELAVLLACEVGAPLHYFEEIGYNAGHEPIIYSREYYRPEFFNFKVVRKMITRSERVS
jgi:GntR family transcriptional regulator